MGTDESGGTSVSIINTSGNRRNPRIYDPDDEMVGDAIRSGNFKVMSLT